MNSQPTVLLTGAAAGIGRAAALRLAQAGWQCVLVDADAAALRRLQDDWPSACAPPLCLAADLSDAAQIDRLAREVPPLDALINNAGMSAGGAEALSAGETDVGARLLALNLAAPARLVLACESRLQPGARIVNMASGAGLRAIPWRGLYSPSKAGLIAQTRALAQARPDWAVTALSPGFVRTVLVQGLIDSGRLDLARALARIPLGRMAEPEDMAEALCFLASPGARVLTGQLLVLDGGSSVYGGSEALPAAVRPALPWNAPPALRCVDVQAPAWRRALDAWPAARHARPAPAAYAAVLDGAALDARPGTMLETVLHAARRFRARHDACASLTLLLAPPAPDAPWAQAGDAAAAHMLVATLAAEWGALGLRINAVEVAAGAAPEACLPLLDYLTGARAQFLTGQLLRPGA